MSHYQKRIECLPKMLTSNDFANFHRIARDTLGRYSCQSVTKTLEKCHILFERPHISHQRPRNKVIVLDLEVN